MHGSEGDKYLPLLYIEDNATERALVKKAILLTGTHFAFYEADSMESAIPYFQFHSEKHPRPALILLDYELGDHTGVDFLHWLRLMKKISSIPVIMFSGTAGKRNIAECYSTGANHFISKPKDFERLKVIVRMLHQSIADFPRPGLIRLLQEYQSDPRERSDTQSTRNPTHRLEGDDPRPEK